MEIEYDPHKRNETLHYRDIDFNDAPILFRGFVLTDYDDREEYGEDRFISVGLLDTRVLVVVWTERGNARRIISMRMATIDEQSYYFRELERSG